MLRAHSADATLSPHGITAQQHAYEAAHAGVQEIQQHHHPHHEQGLRAQGHGAVSLNHTAMMATLHCLTGCTIGEVAGMALGTALGWGNWPTVALAVRWPLPSAMP